MVAITQNIIIPSCTLSSDISSDNYNNPLQPPFILPQTFYPLPPLTLSYFSIAGHLFIKLSSQKQSVNVHSQRSSPHSGPWQFWQGVVENRVPREPGFNTGPDHWHEGDRVIALPCASGACLVKREDQAKNISTSKV